MPRLGIAEPSPNAHTLCPVAVCLSFKPKPMALTQQGATLAKLLGTILAEIVPELLLSIVLHSFYSLLACSLNRAIPVSVSVLWCLLLHHSTEDLVLHMAKDAHSAHLLHECPEMTLICRNLFDISPFGYFSLNGFYLPNQLWVEMMMPEMLNSDQLAGV